MSKFIEQLKHLLKQDISELNNLYKLLETEKETLKSRNSQKIQSLADTKHQIIHSLESRAKLKAKLIAKSGLGIRPGEVETALKTLKDLELIKLWQDSRSKLSECKDKNHINGSIISRTLSRTNKLMSIVRGQNNSQNLYGHQGKEKSYSGSQIIGQA
jgi:flagella synthesis protein FlgN